MRIARILGFALLSTFWIYSSTWAEDLPCADCHESDPDPAAIAESVHGGMECADCHTGVEDFPHSEEASRVDCSVCHDDLVAEYGASIHGQARQNGGTDAPACSSCHGDIHTLVPSTSAESPVNPRRLPETCGACHADPEVVRKYGIPVAKPMEAYQASVHALTVAEGLAGASCSSCHGSHDIQAAGDPRSTVFHARVPETCGACHAEITSAYEASVHGRAARHGAREAPVCTDCHGEHRILAPDRKDSPVYVSNIPKLTCGRCHGDLRLADKYGITGDKVGSYADSYHGLASRSGRVTVAHCGSCHGVHDILPSSDPDSHTHKANLAETCGSCHPGAGRKFAIGQVHVLPDEGDHVAVAWARSIYLWMIYLTIGGMLVHNFLDLYRKTRQPVPQVDRNARTRQRMLPGFRIAHIALIISFVLLVYSGFALKYPEAWWAAPLLRWEESFGLRGLLHRIAAVLMLGALVFHIVHLVVDRQARRCIAKMRPTPHDWRELKERFLWFIGRRPHAPKTPELGYPEKAEYIALMWGIIVMTLTGFFLWFENWALQLFPKWVGDLATVIHFYEAVLATLAIIVWHFYFVIFDPVVYPMDTAWLTGREAPGRAAEREHADDSVGKSEPKRPKPKPNPLPVAPRASPASKSG